MSNSSRYGRYRAGKALFPWSRFPLSPGKASACKGRADRWQRWNLRAQGPLGGHDDSGGNVCPLKPGRARSSGVAALALAKGGFAAHAAAGGRIVPQKLQEWNREFSFFARSCNPVRLPAQRSKATGGRRRMNSAAHANTMTRAAWARRIEDSPAASRIPEWLHAETR